MNPTINEGDTALIKTNFRELKIGDIVNCRCQREGKEYIFIHRIIQIIGTEGDNDCLIRTKGDNVVRPDSFWVKSSEVEGKLILVIPKLKILESWIFFPIDFSSLASAEVFYFRSVQRG